jgi:hypothetical protein
MFPRDVTLINIERLDRMAAAAVETLQMDEDTFRAFYDRTARPVWVYLARITGDRAIADDLLQESYYRFLRAERSFASESHRRNYLYRIATNLAHDRHRSRRGIVDVPVPAITWQPTPSGAPISDERWPGSNHASASCCGSRTPMARRTRKSPSRWACARPASRCCSFAHAGGWRRS